jgi:hypothetical protein
LKPGTFISLCVFFFFQAHTSAQDECGISRKAFTQGEELSFNVTYNWGLVWLESAYAKFTASNGTYNGKACYHFRGEGSTYSGYDWFFKVRDVFESWCDSATMRPLKFTAVMQEGSKHENHTYLFDEKKSRSYTIISRGKKGPKIDTVNISKCTIDVLSAIYHARSIDYSRCRINDTVPVSLLLDGKVFQTYVRFKGRETYTSKELGPYRCVKFSPLLIEGSIFKAGEDMTVWVSDDENKLPLYIETPIVIGKIKVTLTGYKGLRYAEDAKIRPASK